jgi:hypothetical protein
MIFVASRSVHWPMPHTEANCWTLDQDLPSASKPFMNLQSASKPCKNLQSPSKPCKDLQTPAKSCQHLPTPAKSCQHLQTPANTCCKKRSGDGGNDAFWRETAKTCQHLPTPANTCQHLPTPANTCKELQNAAKTFKTLPEDQPEAANHSETFSTRLSKPADHFTLCPLA